MRVYEVTWREKSKRGRDEGKWKILISAMDIKSAQKRGLDLAIKTKFQKSNRVEILTVTLELTIDGEILRVIDD